MRVFQSSPHPLLKPYVARIWGWEAEVGEPVSLPVVLPGTGAEVFFHFGAPFRRADDGTDLGPAHLLCLRHRPLDLAPLSGLGFIAVRFRAGRLWDLIEPPAGECLDRALPVEVLWGCLGRYLLEQVGSAADFCARRQILEHFLLERLEARCTDPLVTAAVDRLYRQPEATTIDTLAYALGLGRRQLERRFQAQEGLSPVEFRRRIRFQKTVRQLFLDPTLSLLDAALDQGYYDQSHFHRDFKYLTGQAPARHLARARQATHFYNTPGK
ncbi:AraC family transcriptional regulator [Aromatoleum aromaticum]|uniref:AraC family transcriptional regulator n=1 Tax=Aromatoleum aromaticum TaxID=551760 RepID=UPI0014592A0A|nr:helix-turn-helix domain-containing protein [Aromatoleum aromaticum]NMG56025.1 helix-turn-helix domain-containing protein [Aromatoleum aromaticum]